MTFKRSVVVLVLIALASAALYAAENDWTTARFDEAQTGYTPMRLGLPLTLCWQYDASRTAQNTSAPAVVDGVVYFSSGNKVYALDSTAGTTKWQYPSVETLSFNIRTGLTVWQDLVLFGGTDGNIYALRTADGRVAWVFPTKGPIHSTPVVSDGIVYVGSDDNSLYAIDARSGELSWKGAFRTKDDILAAPAITPGLVIFASMDTHVYAANSASGLTRWDFRLPMSPVRSAPVISGNIVYICAGNTIYALSTKNGQTRFTVTCPSDIAAPVAVANGDVYVICRNHKMYAYTAGTTSVRAKWSAAVDIGQTSTIPPTIGGNVLYVGCNKGMVCAYSTEDGQLLWRYNIAPSSAGSSNTTQRNDFTNIAAPLVVADNALFVLSDDGALHCFRSQSSDNTAPKIFNVMPRAGTSMNGSPPIQMSAILYDESTGIDPNSISLILDNKENLEYTFDPTTLTLSYQTPITKPLRLLQQGRHFLTILASDWKANELKYEWSFIVDNTLAPKPVPKAAKPETSAKPNDKSRKPRVNRPQPQPAQSSPSEDNNRGLPPPPPGMDIPSPGGPGMPGAPG